MFDIELLITDEIATFLEKANNTTEKAQILVRLLEYDREFPEIATEIEAFYIEQTGERYKTSEHYLNEDDKELVNEYATATEHYAKTKELINKLANISAGMYDYDEVVSSAQNEISPISNIDDFDLSEVEIYQSSEEFRSPYSSFPIPKL